MENKLPHMKSAFKRQTTPGNLAIIGILLWILYPVALDKIRKEPYIETDMVILQDFGESSIIKDTVKVRYPNVGYRNNKLYTSDGVVVCNSSSKGIWEGETINTWDIDTLAGCIVKKLPKGKYKICSTFLLESPSGITRIFGKDPKICSEEIEVS